MKYPMVLALILGLALAAKADGATRLKCKKQLASKRFAMKPPSRAMALTASLLGHGILLVTFAGGWRWIPLNNPLPEIEFRGDSGDEDAAPFQSPTSVIEVELPDFNQTSRYRTSQRLKIEDGRTVIEVVATPEQPLEPEAELVPEADGAPETENVPQAELVHQPEPEPEREPEPEVEIESESTPTEDAGASTEAPTDASLALVERSLLNLKADLDRFIVYPPLAQQYEVEGRVIVSFQLNPSGTISDIHITESSGYQTLDDEALRALRELSRTWYYDGSPETLKSAPIDVVFPVDFKLIRE